MSILGLHGIFEDSNSLPGTEHLHSCKRVGKLISISEGKTKAPGFNLTESKWLQEILKWNNDTKKMVLQKDKATWYQTYASSAVY